MFSPHNLPWLAYSICNLCLYFFCNCKITNKVFESFVQISWEKNMRSDQVKVPFWFKSHFFLFSLKPDRCNSSIFRKRPTVSLIWPHLVLFLKKRHLEIFCFLSSLLIIGLTGSLLFGMYKCLFRPSNCHTTLVI